VTGTQQLEKKEGNLPQVVVFPREACLSRKGAGFRERGRRGTECHEVVSGGVIRGQHCYFTKGQIPAAPRKRPRAGWSCSSEEGNQTLPTDIRGLSLYKMLEGKRDTLAEGQKGGRGGTRHARLGRRKTVLETVAKDGAGSALAPRSVTRRGEGTAQRESEKGHTTLG